ncbi:DUF5691 domain-containing protein [Microbacterium sp. ARD31]|uniref:DUF5691 domain-containing protein n=1 Tax=Microbacterium sp. ARD31 TaxID=2962576 RepID=UPI00288229C8|nr:DUF5691 domain-containing protein [Microbacterium sp. ARD31]MDT0184739.1 DUF5691 domain-containing protein [Microbacterium sp. ARD31]
MSAVDRWLGDVATSALVGSARREPPSAPPELQLEAGDQSAEHRLLAAAAVADALSRGGAPLPPPSDAALGAAAEVRTAASDRAAQLLTLLLTQPPVSKAARDELVVEWLRLADAADQRVPWPLLPVLLDFAAGRGRVATALGGTLGARGRWLAGLNEAWSALLVDADEPRPAVEVDWVEAWPTMSSAEAAAAFALGRRADPAVARELLEAQWSTASAKVRADALRALAPGLSTADEPLLERALDDRAKSVREAAAAMLDRLPDSARAARMAGRLRRLVHVKGLLVRHLEVDVPDAPDEAAVRDGLTAPAKGVSPAPTVWLSQVVRGAPLATWTDITGRDPAATLTMVRDADVLAWITEAVLDRSDTDWAVALVDHGAPDPRLLWLLPEERRARLLADWVERPARGRDLRGLLGDAPRPWPDDLGRAVLGRIQGDRTDPSFGYAVAPLLPVALGPGLAPEVERALTRLPEDASHLRRALTETLQLHAFRTSLTEAFR